MFRFQLLSSNLICIQDPQLASPETLSPPTTTSTVTAAGTAAVGYAWGMLSSMNKMIGSQLSMLQGTPPPPPKILDEALENRYNYTINLLQALSSATTKLGNLIEIDSKRYHELSRIGYYFKQV